MIVLFNIRNLNNVNVQNDCLLNVDPDHNYDVQLPNCFNLDPNGTMIIQLSATTVSRLSLNISSLKKHFLTLQTKITDYFLPTTIGLSMKQKIIQILNNYITLQVITL